MKLLLIIPAILVITYVILGTRHVRDIMIVQNRMQKNPSVGRMILIEQQFQEYPKAVMKMKDAVEIAYEDNGQMVRSYLVYHGPLDYSMAFSLLVKVMKDHPAFKD